MLRVLLVEDDPDVAATSKEALELLGYLVITASNGRQGLELIMSEHPNIVVTDVMMPAMSGLEMVERARNAGYKGSIVVCSAVPVQASGDSLARYDAFLQKPYRIREMADILANLSRRQTQG